MFKPVNNKTLADINRANRLSHDARIDPNAPYNYNSPLVTCPQCKGTGKDDGRTCDFCDGAKKVPKDVADDYEPI
jgi:hypothetical protein